MKNLARPDLDIVPWYHQQQQHSISLQQWRRFSNRPFWHIPGLGDLDLDFGWPWKPYRREWQVDLYQYHQSVCGCNAFHCERIEVRTGRHFHPHYRVIFASKVDLKIENWATVQTSVQYHIQNINLVINKNGRPGIADRGHLVEMKISISPLAIRTTWSRFSHWKRVISGHHYIILSIGIKFKHSMIVFPWLCAYENEMTDWNNCQQMSCNYTYCLIKHSKCEVIWHPQNCCEPGATVISTDNELETNFKGRVSIAVASIPSELPEKIDFENDFFQKFRVTLPWSEIKNQNRTQTDCSRDPEYKNCRITCPNQFCPH